MREKRDKLLLGSTCGVLLFLVWACASVQRGPLSSEQWATALMAHPKISEARAIEWNDFSDLVKLKKTRLAKCKRHYEESRSRYFRIRYQTTDGKSVMGTVAVPKLNRPEYPAVILNHGGYNKRSRFTSCQIGWIDRIWTNYGFVVFAPEYRDEDEYGGKDLIDVLSLYEIAKDIERISAKNMFMAGRSRGGMMTFLALKAGVKVNAAITFCPVTDLVQNDKVNKGKKLVRNSVSKTEYEEALKDRSVIYWPEKIKTPVLMLHGAKDEVTPVAGVKKLSEKFRMLKVPHHLRVYMDGDHCLGGIDYAPMLHGWLAKFGR